MTTFFIGPDEHEPGTWICPFCRAVNSEIDSDCQFCEGDVEEDQPDYSKPISDLGAADHRESSADHRDGTGPTAEEREEEKIFVYLDNLRLDGEVNMFGAAPYVQRRFSLTRAKARMVVAKWMETFHGRHPEEG